jgi:hypothetical protein
MPAARGCGAPTDDPPLGRNNLRPARARTRFSPPLAVVLPCAALLCLPLRADGQEAGVCSEGTISTVFIDNHSVFDPTDPRLNPRFDWAYRFVNSLHVRTREDVIRRELLFDEGACYDIARLRDSERLVRAMPFIANVDIFGVRQADGSFHVIVDTQDEWSTRVEPRFSTGGAGTRGLRVSETNLMGSGQQVSGFYLDREGERSYGLAYHTPQLLNTRWDADLVVGRTAAGHLLSEALTYPFVGQVGRWAVRQAVHHEDRFYELWVPGSRELVPLWVPERRRSLDMGAAYRWGARGHNSTLLGAALSGEWLSYPEEPRFGNRVAPDELPDQVPVLEVETIESIRALFMTGQRSIYFVRRRALDTVNGTEDVRLGVETGIALGPSIPLVSRDRDVAATASLYAAREVVGVLTGAQLMLQGRRNYETDVARSRWEDVLGELDAWAYWRPSAESRHTLVTALRATGGWHTVTPFQLTLGSEAGLRGFGRHLDPGGRRVIASVEHRSYLGWPLPDLFDLGGVAFVDAGKIWPGSAPAGTLSPLRVNAGLGIRAAFPPGSGQNLRVDVGIPLVGREDGGRFRLSIGMGQVIGSSRRGRDRQLERNLSVGASTATFIVPLDQ